MADVVTARAQRDQVCVHIGSGVAAELNMVNLKVPHAPARLASPVVSFEYLPVQNRVVFRVQLQTRALGQILHATLPFTADRNSFFRVSGMKW